LKNEDPTDSGTTASGKAVLYQEVAGAKYEVDLPLTSLVDIPRMMSELGLPSYIDLGYFPMRSAVAVLWACQKAPELHGLYPAVFEKEITNKPIPALLFGGGALKICCEHSNGKGALSRSIKDMDFIVPKNQGSNFCKMLLSLDKAFGTQFKFFRTKADMVFNAMRQGERYRIRTINGITKEGLPTVTVLDVFCDSIDLRHKIDVRDSFKTCKENLYTIGLEFLVLSKSQLIMDIPKTDIHLLKEHNQEFRILPYEHYASDKLVIGMEEKDAKDVCAVFLDHDLGEGTGKIDPEKLRKILEKDKKLALTVTLNLENMMDKKELLERWLGKNEISLVVERVQTLLKAMPMVDKKWNKPWWNTAVETPLIT
jgi:hypothetical protein